VSEGVLVGVILAVGVLVGVKVAVGVLVGVRVGVLDGVLVDEAVGLGVKLLSRQTGIESPRLPGFRVCPYSSYSLTCWTPSKAFKDFKSG
jgi:hypothetical protein